MNLKYAIQDETGEGGQQVTVQQGEIKSLSVFLFKANGCPKYFATLDEIVVHISKGAGVTSLTKKFTLSEVTKITSSDIGGTVGFTVPLTAAETAALPVTQADVSVQFKNSTTVVYEQDFESLINVTAPLVT